MLLFILVKQNTLQIYKKDFSSKVFLRNSFKMCYALSGTFMS